MRPRIPRLAGIATAAALVLGPLAAAPAHAEPGNGTIAVTIVDDLGRPAVASVQMIAPGASEPIVLGVPEGGGAPVAAASFTEAIEAGTYGAMAIGGWAGLSCVGLVTCDVTSMMGQAPTVGGSGVITVNEGVATSLTITIATPKLTGAAGIGQPLTVSVPSSLSALGTMLGAAIGGGAGGLGAGLSADPVVTWNRNGAPLGATGATYTPTTADAGSTINATVTYPAILSLFLGMTAPGVVPAPFATAAVSIGKLTPSVELSVPGKVKQGKRPTVYVNVKVGETLAAGVVTFAVDKLRHQQAVLHSGLATFKLPKLKPGKHKVTASFAAGGAYNAATSTETIVVKANKAKKKHKKHKKK